MAISLHTAGTWVAANATTQTVTLPTHSAGDMLIVRVGFKHATMPSDVTCGTANWNKLGQDNSGTAASSNGGGDVEIAVFWKEATSGAETNPVIDFAGTATPSAACCQVYQKGATEQWLTPEGIGGNISVATNFSATMESHISATTGDLIDAFVITNDNTTLTVPTFTQASLTLDAVTESPATALSSATSNDISADGCFRKATAGTSSAAAVVTGTNSVADIGIAWTTRLRVEAIPAPSGTGAITVPSATVAGTGAEGFTATGAISVPAATVAGTGAEGFTATGAVVVPAVTIAGTGDHTLAAPTGTGSITVPSATVAGTGVEGFTATGSITVPAATVAGTGAEGFTATGAIVGAAPTIAGTGVHVAPVTGTGAIAVSAPTAAGTGLLIVPVTGTGAIVGRAPAVSGVGTGGVVEPPEEGHPQFRYQEVFEPQVFALIVLEGVLGEIHLAVRTGGPFSARFRVEGNTPVLSLTGRVTSPQLLRRRELEDGQIISGLVGEDVDRV